MTQERSQFAAFVVLQGGIFISLIQISDLTFGYEGSYDYVFEHVSCSVDTDWRLGLIARNGRGKTTLLKLLLGEYEYRGSITSSEEFEYFPFSCSDPKAPSADVLTAQLPELALWRLKKELPSLRLSDEVLCRPFGTLSSGEQTKLLLAALFSTEHRFLLIDEPTNHLDAPARALVRDYLKTKRGFLLVSHDRDLLDGCIDHVLVLNRTGAEVFHGTFSTWWENRQRRDAFEQAENEKLKKEIGRLQQSARQAGQWAANAEATKIGKRSLQYEDRKGLRPYIGEKSRKMSMRRKAIEKRTERAVEEKSALLKDLETADALRLAPLAYRKDVLFSARDVVISYPHGSRDDSLSERGNTEAGKDNPNIPKFRPPQTCLPPVTLELHSGDRIALRGGNGCGKSSFLKLLLAEAAASSGAAARPSLPADAMELPFSYTGSLRLPGGLILSYVPQEASSLVGTLTDYAEAHRLDLTLFFTLLRQLDLSRAQLDKRMEDFSAGQKKKVLLAKSLITPAHLYLWDEPLNYIDVFSRIQIEELILAFRPTLLFVEHDKAFTEHIATGCFCYPDGSEPVRTNNHGRSL